MAVIQSGLDSSLLTVDSNGNSRVSLGLPSHPSAGGFYSVTGSQTAVVAATLAASTMLMSMRLAAASTRKAYIERVEVTITPATLGAAATIPGVLGWIRFTAQTPTGGTARTASEMNEPLTTATDITDIRDSNAALTGTAPTFGATVASSPVPLFITSGPLFYTWRFSPAYPLVLTAGDGLALRTIVVMPATQTWTYTYNIIWREQ